MLTRYSALLLPALVACGPAVQGDGIPPTTATPAPVSQPMVPTGTLITVELDQAIGGNMPTQNFTPISATIVDAVLSPTGEVLVPAGATLEGSVTGYYEGGGALPEMVGLRFERLAHGAMSHDLVANIVEVDATMPNGEPVVDRAPAGTPHTHHFGTLIDNAEEFLQENELGPIEGTVVSLGMDRGASLPAGTRITVMLMADLPM
jgi:hypothetical protein